ncbi:MAG TPA: hypothetical protein VLG48_02715 [Candidatus Methylomirabilis sp.]|nr:hypothetical protein [Candidatus Methylomirabilis sp.]
MRCHFKNLVFEGRGAMRIAHGKAIEMLGVRELRRAEGGRS